MKIEGGNIKQFINENLNTITPFGNEEKINLKLYKRNEIRKLKKELDNVDLLKNSLESCKRVFDEIEYSMCKIKDLKSTIERIRNKLLLDEVELFEIKNFAINSNDIVASYKKLKINIDYIKFETMDKVVRLLDPDDLKLTTFRIYDTYNKKLAMYRIDKRNIEEKIFKLSKNIDFNELEMKKLKDERLKIVSLEEEENYNVRKMLSLELYKSLDSLLLNMKSIGKLDLLISKAHLANRYRGIKPSINDENRVYLKNVVNPQMIETLAKRNKKYMPISIDLNKKITLISGANMGGKSVSMKTIILNLYLFQLGCFVFAEEANLCVFDFLYLISDDMQDINKGLSTFGAEIIKLKEIIKLMKFQNGFIVLDEFARGTNPIEGKLLLKSVCTYFKKYNSISLISTHYDIYIEDIDYYQVVGLKNTDFDSLRRKIELKKKDSLSILQDYMDYRLERVDIGVEVPKDAINICKLLGLENEIIKIADEYRKTIDEEEYNE